MMGGHAWERSGSMSDIGTLERYAHIPMYTISASVSGSGSASGVTRTMTGGAGGGTGNHCGDRLRSTSNKRNKLLS